MRKFAMAAIVAALVSACGSERSGTIVTEDGEANYTVDTRSGETNMEIQTADGTATVRSGANVAVNLPAGFSVYPGSTVITSTNAAQGDQRVDSVMLQTSDSMEEVIAFYRGQAERGGIAIESEMSTGDMRAFNGSSDAVEQLGVVATRGDEGTIVQLTVAAGLR